MNEERTDLDVPEGTVWPETHGSAGAADAPPEETPDEAAIELGPGDQPPISLDPDRDAAERNAASGGWDGANEQIENDFEAEQLRRAADGDGDDEVPLT